jgi:branched-chain amino acid transport system permease protein
MTKSAGVRNTILGLGGLFILALLLLLVQSLATAEDPIKGIVKFKGALALFAIWGIAAVSLNLINGTLGILSLGHHGFMLIGGYTTGLLILSEDARVRILVSGRSTMTEQTLGISIKNWFGALGLDALTTDDTLWLRFLVAIVVGGLVAALAGLIVGIPSLRLRGDYLAIVTFGFGEIIRLSASTRLFSPLTNGALGFPGVPQRFGNEQLLWTFGVLVLTVFVMAKLKYSSYGRAMEAIREDEIAAEAMGVNLAYHKVLGFVIAAFFAGIAGGLWVSWLGGVRLDFFLFQLTFFFLVAISAGGTGSVTGVLLGTALVVFVRQYGDPLEQSYAVSTWSQLIGIVLLIAAGALILYRSVQRLRPRGHPVVYLLGAGAILAILLGLAGPSFGYWQATFRGFGMRAIFLSMLLIAIMIFRPSGIVGRSEFSWAWVFGERRDQPTDEERAQDAWLTNPDLQKRLAGEEGTANQADSTSREEG